MIVYGASLSPFVRKVLVFAAEKGIAVEHKALRLGSTNPEFLAASPFGKIPGFVDGDFRISDSSAIVAYLEALHPEPALIPAEPRARARTIWYDEFADTVLVPVMGKIFFNRIVARLIGREGDLAVAARAEADELPPLYDYIEGVMPENGFLVGDGVTLADIAVMSPLINMEHAGAPMDAGKHPKLAKFAAAWRARPSVAGIVDAEVAIVSTVLG